MLAEYFSNFDFTLVVVTLCGILLDVVFGFTKGVVEKNVQSKKLREGLKHKIGFIGTIVLAIFLEIAIDVIDIGITIPTIGAVCAYILLTEVVSIAENLCAINPALINSPIGSLFKHDTKIKEAEELELLNHESEM